MGTTNTTENSLNEIIFENRNKAYGAYAIRKSYDEALVKSFTIAMIVVLALIGSFRFLQKTELKATVIPPDPARTFKPFDPPAPGRIKPPVTPPARSTAAPKSSTIDYLHITDSTQIKKIILDSLLHPNVPSGTGNAGSIGKGLTNQPGDTTTFPFKGEPSPAEPVMRAEIMPEFPGGEAKLLQYLSRNIRFTTEASEIGKDGKMILRFVVDADGSIKNIEVLKKYGYGCEKQAIQVVSEMPKWKPGRMGGQAVPVYFTLPIIYRMEH
jgi:protein TonB